jgi:hypothetical protein
MTYKPGDFCKHINCLSLQHPRKNPCLKEFCLAYQFHDYLSEHGQILTEGSTFVPQVEQLQFQLMLEQENLVEAKTEISKYKQAIYNMAFKVTCSECVQKCGRGSGSVCTWPFTDPDCAKRFVDLFLSEAGGEQDDQT